MTLVRLEPTAPRSRVKHSTTEPLLSEQFEWLEYDASNKPMFCKVCRAENIHSVFTKGGDGKYVFISTDTLKIQYRY